MLYARVSRSASSFITALRFLSSATCRDKTIARYYYSDAPCHDLTGNGGRSIPCDISTSTFPGPCEQ